MSEPTTYRLGDEVELAPGCPIDFESVGPTPGTRGRVVALPRPGDHRRALRVRFDGLVSPWAIPSRYLDPAGQPPRGN